MEFEENLKGGLLGKIRGTPVEEAEECSGTHKPAAAATTAFTPKSL